VSFGSICPGLISAAKNGSLLVNNFVLENFCLSRQYLLNFIANQLNLRVRLILVLASSQGILTVAGSVIAVTHLM